MDIKIIIVGVLFVITDIFVVYKSNKVKNIAIEKIEVLDQEGIDLKYNILTNHRKKVMRIRIANLIGALALAAAIGFIK